MNSDTKPVTLERHKLPMPTKLAFAIGSIGEVFFNGMFNTFIGIFYNQAMGLSNSLVGMAVMIALLFDAVSDPVVGMMSDRWRSKLGRRHPFLFMAPIPLALAIFAIFNPPGFLAQQAGQAGSETQIGLFVWLTTFTILSRLAITLYVIPHLALGAELTRDYHERSRLFSLNSVFSFAVGAMFGFLAWSYFLDGTVIGPLGDPIPKHLDPHSYQPLVLTACAVVLGAIWLSAIGTLHMVPLLSQAASQRDRFTPMMLYREIGELLKNHNYLVLVIGSFFFFITSGLYETFKIFVMTYFWELEASDLRWFGLVALPGALIGATLAPALMRRFDRRPVAIGNLIVMCTIIQFPIDLRLLGILPENGHPFILPFLLGNAFVMSFTFACGSVVILSMLGDVIDENDLATGKRQEGLFYSARTFVGKAANSLGHLFAGLMLDYSVRMPFNAVPGEVGSAVITRLGIAAGPIMAGAALVSIFFYWKYDLSRAQQEANTRALDVRENTEGDASQPQGVTA